MNAATTEPQLKGKHVLLILLAFFGVVFAVNGYFLYAAIHTLPGEERGATYEAGLRYNATLAEQRAQDALHWSHKARFLSASRIGMTVAGADGSPVAGLAVEGWLERPASTKADHLLAFEEVEAGRYEASVETPGSGAWILAVTAKKPRPGMGGAIYRVKERLWNGPAR